MSSKKPKKEAVKQQSLFDLLASKPPDKGGSVGTNRYSFQKSWCLCLLLELHQGGEEYVVVFEHHDDALVLNDVLSPSSVEFYQIKSDSKNWTLKRLVKRDEGKNGPLRSVVGRMIANGIRFSPATKGLYLVSAAPFSLQVSGDPQCVRRTKIKLADLIEEERSALIAALEAEIGSKGPFGCEDAVVFVVTNVPRQTHDTHSRGRLSEFLESTGLHDIQEGPLHRALLAEIERRSRDEEAPADYAELLRSRSISREQFTKMLGSAGRHRRPGEAWNLLSPYLLREGLQLRASKRIERAVRQYEIDSLDKTTSSTHQAFRQNIRDLISKHPQADEIAVTQLMNEIAAKLTPPSGYDIDYNRAAVLFEAYGYFDEIQETDPKPAAEGT